MMLPRRQIVDSKVHVKPYAMFGLYLNDGRGPIILCKLDRAQT